MESKPTQTVKTLKAHVAINVRDVGRSIEFYRKMLGIEPRKVRAGYAKFDVENPPLNLTLNQNSFRERGALSHMGIQVASTADVLAVRERWAAEGLFTRDEMQTNCCYAVQDKTWVRDPDGNEWEAFVVLQDDLAETTACCVTDATGVTEGAGAQASASCSTNVGAAAAEASPASSCGCSTATADEPAASAVASSCCETAAPLTISR